MAQMVDDDIESRAAAWFVRMRDPETADWPGFTHWLEQSPAHLAAYDAVALADEEFAGIGREAAAAPGHAAADHRPANDNERRRVLRFAGIAAALLAMVGAVPTYRALVPTYSIETQLGEQRDVTLDDGTVVALNGGTRITLDRRDGRRVTLDQGEALFEIVHNEAAPFSVLADGAVIQDVGTRFNVARADGQIEIAVAEGSVLYNPKREAVLLERGKILRSKTDASPPVVGLIDPAAVSGWQSGRLTYEDVPMTRVATDISRLVGEKVRLSPADGAGNFTGSLMIDRKDPKSLDRIAPLMGMTAQRDSEGWLLTAQ